MFTLKCVVKMRKIISLGIITFLLIVIPLISLGQIPTTNPTPINLRNYSPVIVDGRRIFDVGNFRDYSAQQRAKIINEAIVKEINSAVPIKLEIIEENKQAIIVNKATKHHLVTLTDSDIISATSMFGQTFIWKEELEKALKRAQYERTEAYFKRTLWTAIIVFIGGIIFHGLLILINQFLNRNLLPHLNSKASFLYGWKAIIQVSLKLFSLLYPVILWLIIFFYISDIFPVSRIIRYELFDILGRPMINLGQKTYSILEFIWLFLLTISLWFSVKGVTFLLKFYVIKPTGASLGIQEVITVLSQYFLTFLGLIILWRIWGFDLSVLAILGSVLGVGIGFGLQNIANNFISGLIITIERPIQVGDFIQIGEFTGTVQRIGARSTEIRTFKQMTIIIPNSSFLQKEVINWSHGNPVSAITIPIQISNNYNIQKVKNTLLKAAQSHPDVLIVPRPKVLLTQIDQSFLLFQLMVWLKDPKLQFFIQSDLNYRIQEQLHSYQGENTLELEIEATEMISDISESSIFIEDRLSQEELDKMIEKMRSLEGIEIKDRRYRLNVYSHCFIGSEAVDWLTEHFNCLRQEAIELGQILVERKIIHHVTDEHPFEDDYLFYRFYLDEL
ncbi:mechanosensitive ion channel domain-containing protein [Aphanothece sacrum]|uniref:Potassium efflux system protein KefA n=1 Tax=Aphanothece sacrum FPU1 TaxID=1920663 RepID=A0A401IDG7_APHSA|nr:mechanosensitive ion channel domain-containing protein [Aphanothece sacrum]GBF79276.1 potassium efflux system protein KefA [Aphanothece sacrum FPU1]GBF86779.1 potassium efflux system protein [Aphanothece sacrum FPU3]